MIYPDGPMPKPKTTPSPIPAARSDVAGVRQVIDWLEQLARADDMDDVAADGGVTVAMIYQQEAAMQARRLEALSHDREVMREALGKIAHPEYGIGFNRLRGIARAALASLKGGA
jgi:hypothetical protein